MPGTRSARACLCGCVLLALAASGCRTVHRPENPRARTTTTPPRDADWPVRVAATPLVVGTTQGPPPTDFGRVGDARLVGFASDETEDTPHVLMAITQADRTQAAAGAPPRRSDAVRVTRPGGAWQVHIARDELTSIAHPWPAETSPARPAPRGTAIYLTSLSAFSRQELALIRTLRRDGWNVVGVTPDLNTLWRVPTPALPGDPDANADRLAHQLDHNLTHQAAAVASVWLWLREHEPAWATGRLVLVGSSAGAINLPTVAAGLARLQPPARPDAAVLIAGGIDIPAIKATSTLDTGRITHPDSGRTLPRDERRAIATRATPRMHLDPSRTVAALDGVPVLLVHARFDRIVPAATGDALFQALGEPERWTYPTGHLGLFLLLPTFDDALADWLDTHTAPPR